MRLGAHVSIAGGLCRVWERADVERCEAVQIFTQSGRGWNAPRRDAGEVREFAAEARRRAVPLLAHDSYLINLAAIDAALRRRSRAAFALELERCEAFGIEHLVLHPGAHCGDGIEVGLPRVAAALRAALDETAGYRVSILIEITAGQGTSLGSRFAEVRWILDEVGDRLRIGVCFDTCHAFAAGYDLRRHAGRVFREFDAIVGLDRIRAFHLNDSRRELGSRVDRHAGIGTGALGNGFFQKLVCDPRFRGLPAVLELPPDLVTDGLRRLRGWRARHDGAQKMYP